MTSTDEARRLLHRIADALDVPASSFERSGPIAPVDIDAFIEAFSRLQPARQSAIAAVIHELAGPPPELPMAAGE